MGYCTECGNYFPDGSLFCTTCGTPVENMGNAEAPAMDAYQEESNGYPDYPQEAPYQDSYQNDYANGYQNNYQRPYGGQIGIMEIYQKAVAVLARKPFRLWGISLLSGLIAGFLGLMFGFALGIGISIGILINVGMTMVYLHGYRGEEVHTVQLFDAFRDGATVKRTLGGMAWTYMWIFLWALIPIAGPFIAIYRSYQYRLVPYILVMEPEVRATEAMHVSKARTNGWKGKMFGADFLVTILMIVVSLVLTLLGRIPVIGILFGIISFLISLVWGLLSKLFFGLVQAAFYEEITARL